MIILRSRSLIIPNDEYNLGNDYDTNTATRVFQLDRVMEGIDLANLMFKLDLTYADGTSDTLALDSEVTDDKINLTWTVTKNQLHVPGTVVVQIRALNVDGNMKWTSYIGAFFVEASMFGSADYNGKLTEVEQFEVAIKSEKERVQNEKARQDAEAERVQAEAERKPAEEERKTAEAERKSAETVRSNAETARESAETEREEWYNSAKTNFDAAIASGDKAEEIANSLETNVEANMKAAAASATAAAGSASAAAGSANEAKQYSQNWSALDQRVAKNADDIAATNNNLSRRLLVGNDIASADLLNDNPAERFGTLSMRFSDGTINQLLLLKDTAAVTIFRNNAWQEQYRFATTSMLSDYISKQGIKFVEQSLKSTQTLSPSTTLLNDASITIPFDCIAILRWKLWCKSSDQKAWFYYMVNGAYTQGQHQWDGTNKNNEEISIFVMSRFSKGQDLTVSVQGNCSVTGDNTSLTRYSFVFIPI